MEWMKRVRFFREKKIIKSVRKAMLQGAEE
jgi:hypothetical protein